MSEKVKLPHIPTNSEIFEQMKNDGEITQKQFNQIIKTFKKIETIWERESKHE